MSYVHALDSFYDDFIQVAPPFRIDWRFVAALAVIALLCTVAVIGTPPAVEAFRDYQAAQVEAGAASAASPTTQLPREWRWEPSAVKYEHMFMGKH